MLENFKKLSTGDLTVTSDTKLAVSKAKEIGCYEEFIKRKEPSLVYMKLVDDTFYQIIFLKGNKNKKENGWILSTLHNYSKNDEHAAFLKLTALMVTEGVDDNISDTFLRVFNN